MAEDLHGYTALITGASSGMGYEMAKQLLTQGAAVILAARGGKKLEEARERLSAFGDVHAAAMDVRDEGSVSAAARWVAERFGGLDMAVCSAGIGRNAPGMEDLPQDCPFEAIPVSAVRAVLETNLLGFFLTAAAFVPLLRRRGGGSLVYVSTSTATMTRPGQIPYGPSKAGGEAMAAILAQELEKDGIAVNVICPGGFTDTPMAGPGMKERLLNSGMPVLQPTVLNKVVSFLASPASAGISGEKLIGKDFDRWLAERGIDFAC